MTDRLQMWLVDDAYFPAAEAFRPRPRQIAAQVCIPAGREWPLARHEVNL